MLFKSTIFTICFMNNFRYDRDSAVTVIPLLKYKGVQTAHIMIRILKYTTGNVSTNFLSLFHATRVRNLYPECHLPPPANLQLRYQHWEQPYLVPSHRQKQTRVINGNACSLFIPKFIKIHPLIELITHAHTELYIRPHAPRHQILKMQMTPNSRQLFLLKILHDSWNFPLHTAISTALPTLYQSTLNPYTYLLT